jgi:hypothetical protein
MNQPTDLRELLREAQQELDSSHYVNEKSDLWKRIDAALAQLPDAKPDGWRDMVNDLLHYFENPPHEFSAEQEDRLISRLHAFLKVLQPPAGKDDRLEEALQISKDMTQAMLIAEDRARTAEHVMQEDCAISAKRAEDAEKRLANSIPREIHERLVWALEEEIASLNAHILRYAEGIAERDAEIERLTSQATQWRAHQDVIRQSVKPNTIHIVLRINKDGVFCEREAVASLYEIQHAVLGSRVVGEKCRRYYEELEDSCDRIASEHERGG